MEVYIDRATQADGPSMLRLLRDSGLPVDGLLEHLQTALVVRDEAGIVGCAALEVYSDAVLLRSVAVSRSARSRGVGRQLTDAAISLAKSLGLTAIYLLTTTAEGYFAKLGFVVITRGEVPANVQESVEFRSVCPASAVVMRRHC